MIRKVKRVAGDTLVDQSSDRAQFGMLGFKSFRNGCIVIAGIELIQKLKKGQYGVPYNFGISSPDIWTNVLAA